jgi:membrane-bound serine protease (ClpP class)
MDPSAIVVFAIGGVILIVCEIFIPGGIVGTVGGIVLALAVIAGFFHDPALGAGLLVGSMIFGMLALWAWVKLLPRTPFGKRFILQSDGSTWDGFDATKSELLGKSGIARTALHPGGVAIIDNKRVDVVTRGEMIDPETEIRVVDVEGNRVVVASD